MCSATPAEHLWERQSCSVVPRLPGTAPRGRGSRVQGVGCASRGSGTAQWSPLWAGAPCPALRPRGLRVQGGEPRAPWPRAGQGGVPWVISAADSASRSSAVCLNQHKWQQQSKHLQEGFRARGRENPAVPQSLPAAELPVQGPGLQGTVLHSSNCTACAAGAPKASPLFTMCVCQFNSLFVTENKSWFILSI